VTSLTNQGLSYYTRCNLVTKNHGHSGCYVIHKPRSTESVASGYIQGDQKVSVHLMIKIQKVNK